MNNSDSIKLPEKRPRILVVDDEPINIKVVHQIFKEDCELFMATDGEQAVEVAQREIPDLILLDVMMPNVDGIEACRRLKQNQITAHIPVVFITGQNAPEQETAGLEVGAVDFINKPVNPSVVRARVKTHLLVAAQAEYLRTIALQDGLTGVANRRHFDAQLEQSWRACMRNNSPLGIILIDVDHFKKFNDHNGHLAGDEALQDVATELKAGLRRARDVVARYGGEEFICLLPDTNHDDTVRTAEHLRSRIEDLNIEHESSPEDKKVVTVSLGAFAAVPEKSKKPEEFLQIADERLYEAKRSGRNKVSS